jgi:hypothetical protein
MGPATSGQSIQTGREILKKLFRVHFLESTLTVNSNVRQGQQNLDVCRHTMNREDLNLARNVINQYKIRWDLCTFKPFKSVGTY